MGLQKEISTIKGRLKKKAKIYGAYENFGQSEVMRLMEKHEYTSLLYGTTKQREQADLIREFDTWCMNFTG